MSAWNAASNGAELECRKCGRWTEGRAGGRPICRTCHDKLEELEAYRLPGMNGGCRCDRSHWRVVHYHEHRSAFAGYRSTWSQYSRVKCELCGHTWRTKAKYVDSLPMQGGGRAVGEKRDA